MTDTAWPGMLPDLVALAAITLAVVELALRLPLGRAVSDMVTPSLRSVGVMRARAISEHWKERAMLLFARRTLAAVARFLGCLALLLGLALALGWAVTLARPGFAAFALGLPGLAISTALAVLWLWLRGRIAQRGAVAPGSAPVSDYTQGEQALHRLALDQGAMAGLSFTLDQWIARPDAQAAREGAHVFVAGLARSGTTALIRALHDTGAFASLTYRDMPFVLAPNLWGRLQARRAARGTTAERAHGDGIMVGLDSPESLEEPFWRAFDGPAYLKIDRLLPHDPPAPVMLRYTRYVAAILKAYRGTRYLAKNNNNILRLPALAERFPRAALLVPFRHPLTQARSLLAQHHRFTARHAADPFSRDYMGWLAHHEFGSDHRAFALNGRPGGDPDSLAYWVEAWCITYAWLLDTGPARARFLCYEDLCNDPAAWPALARSLDLAPDRAAMPFRPAGIPALPDPALDLAPDLQSRAAELYARLRARAATDPGRGAA